MGNGLSVAHAERVTVGTLRFAHPTLLLGAMIDLIVSLSPEAHHKALQLAQGFAVEVEYWPTQDPTLTDGRSEQILDAYRVVRGGLFRRIKARFPLMGGSCPLLTQSGLRGDAAGARVGIETHNDYEGSCTPLHRFATAILREKLW